MRSILNPLSLVEVSFQFNAIEAARAGVAAAKTINADSVV
jgi:hypothetical protein